MKVTPLAPSVPGYLRPVTTPGSRFADDGRGAGLPVRPTRRPRAATRVAPAKPTLVASLRSAASGGCPLAPAPSASAGNTRPARPGDPVGPTGPSPWLGEKFEFACYAALVGSLLVGLILCLFV